MTLQRFLIALLLLPAAATGAAPGTPPSFTRDVLPVFQKNCVLCHSEPVKAGGLLLGSYKDVMTGGNSGPAIVAGKGNESLLIKKLDGRSKPQMPQGMAPLDEQTIELIRRWIDAGARAPEPNEAAGTSAAPAVAVPNIKPTVPVRSQVGSLAFRPDGKLLAAGRYKTVELVEPGSGRVIGTLPGHIDVVRALAFSPDGRLLAAAGGLPARRGEVRIWDVETRRETRVIEGHSDCIYAVAFSPDGHLLATAGYDKLIKLWELSDGREEKTLKDHIDAIFALAFSPDGKRLASGAADRTVKVWDPATGKRLYTLSDAQDAIYSLAWHPSGTLIAAGGADKTLRTWELHEGDSPGGKLAQSITGHEDAILQVTYSPDGKSLVTASADRHIKVWDPETLVERAVLETQPDWVLALTFSPDGKWLVAGRYDGSLGFYDPAHYPEKQAVPLRASK